MGGMSCGEVSLVPWRILKHSVNNCISITDEFIPQTIAMLEKKYFGDKSIIAGECATPGIISLIAASEDKNIKHELELNEKSNILLMGCEGDADEDLYKKLLNQGIKQII